MNNRILLLIFICGLGLFAAGKIFSPRQTSSFDPVLIEVDTARVDKIRFTENNDSYFDLVRSDSGWKAIKGDKEVTAPAANVNSVLQVISKLTAKRIVTKDTSKYTEYEILQDQVASIQVWIGDKEIADLLIGGFRFDQAARTASAFVRKRNAPEVYLIDGLLMMGMKQNFDQYRDRTIVKINAEDLLKVEWMNDSGRKEVIQKEDGIWHYAGMEAVDSSAFAGYLNSLVHAKGADFSDLNTTDGLEFLESLTLYGNNMVEPTVISSFKNIEDQMSFLIHSSINDDSVFKSDSMGLYKLIFTDMRQFWPDGQ